MRILLTGGAGYIGSHTAKRLAMAGHQPVVFDDLSQGHDWAVKWGPLERGSLSDPVRLAEDFTSHNIDAVVHFAANALVGESMTNPAKYPQQPGNPRESRVARYSAGMDVLLDTVDATCPADASVMTSFPPSPWKLSSVTVAGSNTRPTSVGLRSRPRLLGRNAVGKLA